MRTVVDDFDYEDAIEFEEAGWTATSNNEHIELRFGDSNLTAWTSFVGDASPETSVIGSWARTFLPGEWQGSVVLRDLNLSDAFPLIDNGKGVGIAVNIVSQHETSGVQTHTFALTKVDESQFRLGLYSPEDFTEELLVPPSFIEEITITKTSTTFSVSSDGFDTVQVDTLSSSGDPVEFSVEIEFVLSVIHDPPTTEREISLGYIEFTVGQARTYHNPYGSATFREATTSFTGV